MNIIPSMTNLKKAKESPDHIIIQCYLFFMGSLDQPHPNIEMLLNVLYQIC